jgi:hypothetical protein
LLHLTSWRTVTAAATMAAVAAGAFGLGAAVSDPPEAPAPIELTSEGTPLGDPVDDDLVPPVDLDDPGDDATARADDGASAGEEADDASDIDDPSDEVVTPDAAPTEVAAPETLPADPDSPEGADGSADPAESADSPDSAS